MNPVFVISVAAAISIFHPFARLRAKNETKRDCSLCFLTFFYCADATISILFFFFLMITSSLFFNNNQEEKIEFYAKEITLWFHTQYRLHFEFRSSRNVIPYACRKNRFTTADTYLVQQKISFQKVLLMKSTFGSFSSFELHRDD